MTLAEIMKERKVNTEMLVHMTGISQPQIWRLTNNRIRFNERTLFAITHALHCNAFANENGTIDFAPLPMPPGASFNYISYVRPTLADKQIGWGFAYCVIHKARERERLAVAAAKMLREDGKEVQAFIKQHCPNPGISSLPKVRKCLESFLNV